MLRANLKTVVTNSCDSPPRSSAPDSTETVFFYSRCEGINCRLERYWERPQPSPSLSALCPHQGGRDRILLEKSGFGSSVDEGVEISSVRSHTSTRTRALIQ